MKSRCVVFAAAVLALTACAPYRINYRHVVLDEAAGLEVLARSSPAIHTQDQPLRNAKFGIPLEATLKRERYEIDFNMPLNIGPRVSLRVRTPQGALLVAEGKYLGRMDPGSIEEHEGYKYLFRVEEARGAPLDIVIRTPDGVELGRERLTYKLRSRGVKYGIDWI